MRVVSEEDYKFLESRKRRMQSKNKGRKPVEEGDADDEREDVNKEEEEEQDKEGG